MNCPECQTENLRDSLLCKNCETKFQFKHRAGCACSACGAELVEISGLNTDFDLGHADPDRDYETEYDEQVAYSALRVVEISGLSEPAEYALVDQNFQPINADIDPDYEAAWAARESWEAAA